MHTIPDLNRDFRASLLSDENTRRLLRIFTALVLASSSFYLAAAQFLAGHETLKSAGVIAAFCSSLGAFVLLRRNRIDLAAPVLVWGLWLSLLLQLFISNGMMSRSLMVLPIIVVLAGWLLSARNAILLCIATILCGLALALAERAGLLPLFVSPSPPLLAWLAFSIYVMLAAAVAYHIFRGFRLRHEALRKLGIELSGRVEALAAREAELNLLMESVPVMIFHGDRDKRCIFANRSYAAFYASPEERPIGLTVREIVGEEAYGGLDERLDRVLAGEPLAYRAARKSPRGEEAILDIQLLPETVDKGETRGFFAVIHNVTAQVQAETELRRSEEKFAKVFRSNPLAVAITRLADGSYVDVNETWLRIFGWAREEVIGRTSLELGKWLQADDRNAWAEALSQYGRVTNLEIGFRTKDGRVRQVLLSAELIDLAGVQCALVMLSDITDRKLAEQALRASEERLRLATSGAGVGIWEWDVASNRLEWNEQLKAIFGLPPDATGLTLEGFIGAIHTEDLAYVQAAYGSALESHGEFDCEYRIVRPDGSVHWIVARGHGHYDAAGKPLRMVGAAIDTTERKTVEESLRESREEFAKIFKASPVTILITNLETGRYLDVNDAFCRQFGWAREEAIGRTSLEIGIWPNQEERERWVREVRQHGTISDYEVALRTKSGDLLQTMVAAETIEIGGVPCVISLIHDITARKRAEEEVRQLNSDLEGRVRARTAELTVTNKELESFAYSISHDLRAPLRGIDGFSKLLLDDYSEKLDEQGRGYLDRVRRAAQRMGALIDDILELSRVSRHSMRQDKVDLSHMAAEILDELARAAPQRQIDARVATGCTAVGDPQLLRVLLQNLLENAWKYTGRTARARIEFGCEDVDGEAVFHVRDNGVGFDMRYADRLFAPFQRLHPPGEFEGTGIGLATVARVAARHGGRVWAESELDRGTILRFTLGGTGK